MDNLDFDLFMEEIAQEVFKSNYSEIENMYLNIVG